MNRLFVLILALFMQACAGQPLRREDDIDQCVAVDGTPMKPQLCALLRQHRAERDQRALELEEARTRSRLAAEQREREQRAAAVREAAEDERRRLDAKVERERRAAEDAAAAEQAARQAQEAKERHEAWLQQREAMRIEFERDEAIAARKQAKAVAERKQECGADYLRPRIGMELRRLQRCVANVRMVSQVNRADGVLTLYQGRGLTVGVMGGRVVSWNQF